MTAVEQGLSIRVIERGSPLENPAMRGEFRRATMTWLGYSPGVEWLHDEANRRLAEEVQGWYYVESDRRSAHLGAGGEISHLVIELLGAGVAGKVISDLIDYAKARIADWRDELGAGFDPPPDLARYELDDLVDRLRGELAEMLDFPEDRIEATGRRVETQLLAETTFRDKQTGQEFRVEIDRSHVTFTRLEED